MSALIGGQGRSPLLPIPIGGLRLVATIKYMGFGCIRIGVMVVVVVLMIRFAADMSSVPSKGSTNDTVICRCVGDGGPDKVVDGGVGIVVILST